MSKIIFDNAGGITVQFYDTGIADFAAHTFDARLAAEWLLDFLADSDLSGWEGHDEDAMALDPTMEQIRNGGYREFIFDHFDLDSVRDLVTAAEQCGWGNTDEFAARMRESETFARIEA